MTKQYIAITDKVQTLTNKTINATNNTIYNIAAANFQSQTVADEGKVWEVKNDGTWELGKIQQYKKVSTFTGEVGDIKTLYYLDTSYSTFNTGLYIYDSTSSTFIPAAISGNIVVDNVTIGLTTSGAVYVKDNGLTVAKFDTTALSTTIPSTGAVDTKITTEKAVWDRVKVAAHTLEFTMDATTYKLTAVLKDAEGTVLSTQEVDLPLEEMVVNVTYDNTTQAFIFTLKNGTTITVPASGILRGVVTETATQTLTNKTISADDNTIQNLEADNLKAVTTNDVDKVFEVKSDGTWELNYPTIVHEVSVLPATGVQKFVYFLDVDSGGYKAGLYIWDGSAYKALASATTVDNVTIESTASGIAVKDGGLTVAKFNATAISTTIPASASAVDTKFPTEKAVATLAEGKIPFATGSTSEAFSIGEDTEGYYIEE